MTARFPNTSVATEVTEGAMATDREIAHLLRRTGFGATQDDVAYYGDLGLLGTLDELLDYEQFSDDVDVNIGRPEFAGVTARGQFSPNTVIADARQRWLFRMVHTRRPLQEKMALFWHNHFATAYSKLAGAYGATDATRMMAAAPSEDPAKAKGQIELFREHALGNFRDLLLSVTKDVAMLVWLDGRTNVRGRPQENYARELMELFTMGVGFYTEQDVYAGARVFTGWNLQRTGERGAPDSYYAFAYLDRQHDTDAKDFSFPIYRDGSRRIPARSASAGQQDGVDLIDAVCRHPETGPRLARKLYAFFVSDEGDAPERFVADVAATYYRSGYDMKAVVRRVLLSPEFRDPASHHARYSWPVEFVVRAIREIGWRGFSVNSALTPLVNMGQQLLEPPDVNGWELGRGWFSTGAMLARMNFAAALATNQKFNLRDMARPYRQSPQTLVSFFVDRMSPAPLDADAYGALVDYAQSSGAWTGSDAQLATKASGLAHLIGASGEYQLV
ncbi:MAG TPA: DUF1800 domain-containing protein [Candidatus Limnocylindrales bacterium]|nr:DUF1800 domain-containing protein [Candidatus Limnocylindrales bacterium]